MNAIVRIKDSERDSQSQPVRIAILDTGIDSKFSQSKRIKHYHDFISGNHASYHDNTGHGTKVFQLILKVCDVAEFYIGRVWEGKQATTQTPRLMEKVSPVSVESLRYPLPQWTLI